MTRLLPVNGSALDPLVGHMADVWFFGDFSFPLKNRKIKGKLKRIPTPFLLHCLLPHSLSIFSFWKICVEFGKAQGTEAEGDSKGNSIK